MTARDVDRLLCVNGEQGPNYIQRADREKVAKYVRELEGRVRELQVQGETKESEANPIDRLYPYPAGA